MGPLKSLRYPEVILLLFYRKDKAKICLIQQNFLLSKLKLELELNEL